jgi:FAD/FMN-containing dehydrogenase
VQSSTGGHLSTFEVIWQSAYKRMSDTVHGVKTPLSREHPCHVLTEVMGGKTGDGVRQPIERIDLGRTRKRPDQAAPPSAMPVSRETALMRALKRSLDPKGVLNSGWIFKMEQGSAWTA